MEDFKVELEKVMLYFLTTEEGSTVSDFKREMPVIYKKLSEKLLLPEDDKEGCIKVLQTSINMGSKGVTLKVVSLPKS